MAINQYLIAAAGQLEAAANALQGEIDRVRADYMSFEQQATRDITSKEGDMRAAVGRAATGGEAPEIAHFTVQAARLRSEIADLKKQIAERQRQMQDDIRDKQGAISDLMGKARELQSQAANFS